MSDMSESEPKRPAVERKGLTVHVDGVPAVLVEAPMSTRPQDWTPGARAILFEELVRSERIRHR